MDVTKASNFSIQERLQGWHIRQRPCKDNRIVKFYVHLQSRLQFKSLNEVDDFVHLGLHPERSSPTGRTSITESPIEQGTPANPATRRALTWDFHIIRLRADGTKICNIKLHENDMKSQGSRAYHGTGSSKETMIKQSDECEEEEREYAKDKVKAFYKDSYQNLVNLPDSVEEQKKVSPEELEAFLANFYQNLFSSHQPNTSSTATENKSRKREENRAEYSSHKKPRT